MLKVPKVTIEWNAVIEKEEHRSGAPFLDELYAMHRRSEIDLGIATTAASENTRERLLPNQAKQFRQRLTSLGWGELSMVLTQSRPSLTFFGLSRMIGDDADEVPNKLWELIKPTSVPRSHRDFMAEKELPSETPLSAPEYQKWRNKWCDVFSLEAHIAARRDLFVSGDVKNFSGPRYQDLLDLGVGDICAFESAPVRARELMKG